MIVRLFGFLFLQSCQSTAGVLKDCLRLSLVRPIVKPEVFGFACDCSGVSAPEIPTSIPRTTTRGGSYV